MAIPRCPNCAAPLSTVSTSSGSPACTSCGALLTPSHVQFVSWNGPGGDAPAQSASLASAPRRKSGGLAVLFELVIPGSGAMYAGHAAMGFIWLVLSLAAVAAAEIALASEVAKPLLLSRFPYLQLPTDATFIPFYAGIGLVALVWFAMRATIASSYTAAHNHRLLVHAMPAVYGRPAAGGSRDINPSAGQAVRTLVTILIEMIPGPIAGYGIGDMATAAEALFGRTMDGLKLTPTERLVYLGASAIPVVPARPIIAVYRRLTRKQSA